MLWATMPGLSSANFVFSSCNFHGSGMYFCLQKEGKLINLILVWAPCVSLIMVAPRTGFFSCSVWKGRDRFGESISRLCLMLCIYPSQWNNQRKASGLFAPSHPLLWDPSWGHMLMLFRLCDTGNTIIQVIFSGSFPLPCVNTESTESN